MLKKLLTIALATYAVSFLAIGVVHADFGINGDLSKAAQQEGGLNTASPMESMAPVTAKLGITDITAQTGKLAASDSDHWAMAIGDHQNNALAMPTAGSFDHPLFHVNSDNLTTGATSRSKTKSPKVVANASMMPEMKWVSFLAPKWSFLEIVLLGMMVAGCLIGMKKLVFAATRQAV